MSHLNFRDKLERDFAASLQSKQDTTMTDTKPSDVEELEPVAWLYRHGGVSVPLTDRAEDMTTRGWTETPLYAHPPATTLAAQQARIEALQKIVTELAEFDARNSIVHLRDMARAALKEPTT